ncbi:MAG: GNAT family N-acetyltransferase [Spirochaetales bacterium]|nr:MAG: GNAT family N-acetyltransferase [Spirochaetales bacterium]
MKLELTIVFSERQELTGYERDAVENIKRLCLEFDGYEPGIHFDARLNAIKTMPAIFLAEAKGASGESRVVGAAFIFAPGRSEGEFSACIDPLFRRSGLFSQLFSMAVNTLVSAGVPSLLLVSDGRLGNGGSIARKLGAERSYGEITMVLVPKKSRLESPTALYAGSVRLVPFSHKELDDLAALPADIFVGSFQDERALIESSIDDPACEHYSVRSAEGIVGLVALYGKDGDYMINGLSVLPSLRRKGYGGAILDAVISILRRRNASSVRLEVEETNVAAIALYRSRNFTEESRTEYWRVSLDSLGYAVP